MSKSEATEVITENKHSYNIENTTNAPITFRYLTDDGTRLVTLGAACDRLAAVKSKEIESCEKVVSGEVWNLIGSKVEAMSRQPMRPIRFHKL
jgi:hypothetical protein